LGFFTDFNNRTDISLSPFARYYFLEKEASSFFGSMSINVLDYSTFSDNVSVFNNYVIGAGHTWFITKSVGIEAAVNVAGGFGDVVFFSTLGFQIYLEDLKFKKGS